MHLIELKVSMQIKHNKVLNTVRFRSLGRRKNAAPVNTTLGIHKVYAQNEMNSSKSFISVLHGKINMEVII